MPWRPRLCSIKYGRTWHRVVPTVTPVTRAAPVWFPWLLLIFEDGCVCVCSPSVPILFRFLNIIPPVLFLWGLVDLRWAAGPYGAAVKAHSCVNVDVSQHARCSLCVFVPIWLFVCLSVCSFYHNVSDMPLAAIQVQPDPLQPKPTLAAERCEYCRM